MTTSRVLMQQTPAALVAAALTRGVRKGSIIASVENGLIHNITVNRRKAFALYVPEQRGPFAIYLTLNEIYAANPLPVF